MVISSTNTGLQVPIRLYHAPNACFASKASISASGYLLLPAGVAK
jgi:hypothetical protein